VLGEADKTLFHIHLSREEFIELCDLRYRLIFEPDMTVSLLTLVRPEAA
jgi:hypothetical protein